MVHFRRRSQGAYELVPRSSSDDPDRPSLDEEHGSGRVRSSSGSWLPELLRLRRYARLTSSKVPGAAKKVPRRVCRFFYCSMAAVPYLLIILVLAASTLRPSYTHPPAQYKELRRRAAESREPGRANVRNEKVYIAATLYDKGGELVGGEWGRNLLELVDLLGPDNVFVSIYENDPDSQAQDALDAFKKKLKCKSVVASEHLSLASLPHISLPSGEKHLKRIAFLAEVRNRALAPLLSPPASQIQFDKLLFINDVFYSPVDAAQLLFSTGQDPKTGKTNYGAACAVDFINPFKFYDRFATRDLEGYSMGIPFYPWFTDAGRGASRQDVLDQKDAVRLRACWGGMTAFEASWFQRNVSSAARPYLSFTRDAAFAVRGGVGLNGAGALRFRYEADTFWDASECCLIHADLQYLRHGRVSSASASDAAAAADVDADADAGIYMNPFVRVAYDPATLRWLPWTRRPERLYAAAHNWLNHLVALPEPNARRAEEPGDIVRERVWSYLQMDREGADGGPGAGSASGAAEGKGNGARKGKYREVERVVGPGRFCGGRKLLVINEHPKDGEKKWLDLPVPADS